MYPTNPSRSSSRLSTGSYNSEDLNLFRMDSGRNTLNLAPQAAEDSDEESSEDDSYGGDNAKKKDSLPGFIAKLYEMFHSKQYSKHCGWSDDGETIVIYSQNDFTSLVIPKFLKTNKFQSFQRQLNMYCFSRVQGNYEVEFRHPYFLKGRRDLLHHISRESKQMKEKRKSNGSDNAAPPKKTPKKIVKSTQQSISVSAYEPVEQHATSITIEKRVQTLETKTKLLSAENIELKKSLQELKSKVDKMKVESNTSAENPFGSRSNSGEWALQSKQTSSDLFGGIFRTFSSMGGSWNAGV